MTVSHAILPADEALPAPPDDLPLAGEAVA